jgi:hypothetical protein
MPDIFHRKNPPARQSSAVHFLSRHALLPAGIKNPRAPAPQHIQSLAGTPAICHPGITAARAKNTPARNHFSAFFCFNLHPLPLRLFVFS